MFRGPRLFLLFFFILSSPDYLHAQNLVKNEPLMPWNAFWITNPECNSTGPVLLFRKKIHLDSKPSSFRIKISADNTYKLYVNNHYIDKGPQPSDIHHWKYRIKDIGQSLKQGNNIICIEVYHPSNIEYCYKIGIEPALIIQGIGKTEQILNTNNSWKVKASSAQTIQKSENPQCNGFFEKTDGTKYPWNWKTYDFNDSHWLQAKQTENGKPVGISPAIRNLEPEIISNAQFNKQYIPRLIRHSNPEMVDTGFLFGSRPFIIPKNENYKILIDNDSLAFGYPVLITRFGKDASVQIKYSDALIDSSGLKGNRNEHNNKKINGPYDEFIVDGGEYRTYSPFSPRFFRFIELNIKTQDNELEISEFYMEAPSRNNKQETFFISDDEALNKIWKICSYSNQLCSQDIFIPNNSGQLIQTMRPSLIQAEINAYLTGDVSRWKNNLLQFKNTITPDGLIQSTTPNETYDPDPVSSLMWIYSVYNYYMYSGNLEEIKIFVPTLISILFWFESQLDERGLLKKLSWNSIPDDILFYKRFNTDRPNYCPLIIDFMYIYALQQSAEIFEKLDYRDEASQKLYISQKLQKAINKICYDKERGYYREIPGEDIYTKHSNTFAILTETILPEIRTELMDSLLHGNTLINTSLQFSYFLFQAMGVTDNQNNFLKNLYPWHNMVLDGLSTTCENYSNESVGYECYPANGHLALFTIKLLCGVTAKEAGYKKIVISPQLSDVKSINTSFYLSGGKVEYLAQVDLFTKKLYANITLPKGTSGYLKWEGKLISLSPGFNKIEK